MVRRFDQILSTFIIPNWKGMTAADLLEERVEEGDGLDGLPQAHLISQDGVGVLGPGEAQPVESLQLVGVQLAARCRDVIRLLLVLLSNGLWGGGWVGVRLGRPLCVWSRRTCWECLDFGRPLFFSFLRGSISSRSCSYCSTAL